MIFSEDAPVLEAQCHRYFVLAQVSKVNHRKEFLRIDLADVRSEIESFGSTATWTMAAAAREYRESLAIERVIAADPRQREASLKRKFALEPALADDDRPSAPVASGPELSLGADTTVMFPEPKPDHIAT